MRVEAQEYLERSGVAPRRPHIGIKKGLSNMPTGYTCAVQEGKVTTLRDFTMLCVRAFGVCASLRDAPFDTPIPEKFEPSDYYVKRIETLKDRLAWLNQLTAEEKEREAEAQYKNAMRSHEEYSEQKKLSKTRYENMLAKVRDWDAPEECRKLKDFMLDQLSLSIDSDCYDFGVKAPKRLSADEWFATEHKFVIDSIQRATKDYAEEVKDAAKRNQWMDALRASLPIES